MKKDNLPQSWKDKLLSFQFGEERIYNYETQTQVMCAIRAIDRAKRHGLFFKIFISNSKFSIKRIEQ